MGHLEAERGDSAAGRRGTSVEAALVTGDALEPAMPPGGFDLELAVSELASNSTDVSLMVRLLIDQLGPVLGQRMTVERSGGRLRRSGEIKSVRVDLGDDVLVAEVDGASVRCTIGHSSGGIRIRSDRVDIETWLRRLLGALGAEAARSEQTRRALENIVIGGST